MAGKGRLAQSIRTGLEEPMRLKVVDAPVNPLDQLYFKRPVRIHVREFAALFATIFLLISAYLIHISKEFGSATGLLIFAAAVLIFLGYRHPHILRPVWKGWMAFAEKLGYLMTFVIMFVTWILIVIPTAIVVKLFAQKIMDLSFRSSAESYWETRDSKYDDFKLLERQF